MSAVSLTHQLATVETKYSETHSMVQEIADVRDWVRRIGILA